MVQSSIYLLVTFQVGGPREQSGLWDLKSEPLTLAAGHPVSARGSRIPALEIIIYYKRRNTVDHACQPCRPSPVGESVVAYTRRTGQSPRLSETPVSMDSLLSGLCLLSAVKNCLLVPGGDCVFFFCLFLFVLYGGA